MEKKYFNLTNTKMNLQIERYKTMPVSIGVGTYPSKIADKFPSIFKLIEDDTKTAPEIKMAIEIEEVLPQVMEKDIDEFLIETEEKDVKEINYARMTHTKLKELVVEKNLDIDGRNTSRKMIEALEANDEK